MKYFLFITCLLFSCCAYCQTSRSSSKQSTIYTKVDKMPQYPGGNQALANALLDSVDLPNVKWEEIDDSDMVNTVTLALIIDEKGNVEDAQIVKSMNKRMDEKFLTIARRWKFTPGMKDGKPVKVKYILPFDVEFR